MSFGWSTLRTPTSRRSLDDSSHWWAPKRGWTKCSRNERPTDRDSTVAGLPLKARGKNPVLHGQIDVQTERASKSSASLIHIDHAPFHYCPSHLHAVLIAGPTCFPSFPFSRPTSPSHNQSASHEWHRRPVKGGWWSGISRWVWDDRRPGSGDVQCFQSAG
jgi:hypothetical protein